MSDEPVNGELEYKPPFELWKVNGGIDGWDQKRWLIARFTTKEKAVEYLRARRYTFIEGWRYRHAEESHRHTMGEISYELREVKAEVPIDPK